MTDGLNAVWSNDRAAHTDTNPKNLELAHEYSRYIHCNRALDDVYVKFNKLSCTRTVLLVDVFLML